MQREPKSDSRPAPTRVVLVDDHIAMRQMFTMLLVKEGYEVVGAAGAGIAAMKVCRATRPDLVILDLMLPELGGVHLIRLLLKEEWPVRVVVYSGSADEALLREALAEGPHGFVCKDDSMEELFVALRVVAGGSRHVSMRAGRLVPKAGLNGLGALTTRECAVLQMIAEGRHTKEIAEVLGASVKTVDHDREHLMRKLNRHDVASLTRYAVRHHLVNP